MSSASARLSRLNPGGWARIRQHKWAKIHGHSHHGASRSWDTRHGRCLYVVADAGLIDVKWRAGVPIVSWPASCRPPTTGGAGGGKVVDGRGAPHNQQAAAQAKPSPH